MWASCLKARHSHNAARQRGFTLLEVLVVLALVGLLTAFTLPQFSIIRDRLTFNMNRESFERELSGLRYAAFREGRAVVLNGEYPRPAKTEEPASSSSGSIFKNEPDFSEPGQLRPMRPTIYLDAQLTLPDTWSLSVKEPIIYQPSGFCGGGTVDLLIGQVRYVYDLKAPACQAQLK